MTPSELNKLLESFHPLENRLLLSFSRAESLSAADIIDASGLDESRLDMAAGWLHRDGGRVFGEEIDGDEKGNDEPSSKT